MHIQATGEFTLLNVKFVTSDSAFARSPSLPLGKWKQAKETILVLTGGCYCGQLRYEVQGKPLLKGQCHCRPCQHLSGGAPNVFMMMAAADFVWTQGAPKTFSRADLPNPVAREFCSNCGTHVVNRPHGLPSVVVKVGTLDNPSLFKVPRIAMFASEKQAFHHIPDGMPTFTGLPSA